MSYQVRSEVRSAASGFDPTVCILEESTGTTRAEIWPALGFNCFSWRAQAGGHALDLIYADSKFLETAQPTRNGIPILFPFPGRIRDGRFPWYGKTYQLPINDSKGHNAIHGFACRRPWRVVGQGADDSNAWVTGEFWGATDAPETVVLWPADYRIRVTYRLTANALSIEATVDNPGRALLPFGLGYHPYFRVPITADGESGQCRVESIADAYWEVENLLPTGRVRAIDAMRDLRQPRQFSDLSMDDLLTRLNSAETAKVGPLVWGQLEQLPENIRLSLLSAPAFRQLIVFTPPHRQAVCLEPYTCTGDAINLQQRGIDAGLLVLEPGAAWSGAVEMRV
jgi:aldose 1-epimerase